jgi:hypothetical protein
LHNYCRAKTIIEMKGIKNSTNIQVGDLIKAKSTVTTYSGDSGLNDADTVFVGKELGEITKIVGSLLVYKEVVSGRIRNTLSSSSIDFRANPDFEYTSSQNNNPYVAPWWQKVISAGLDIFRGTQSGGTNSDGSNTSGTSGSKPNANTDNPKDPSNDNPSFFEKYGIYGLVILVLGILGYVFFGGKKVKPVQNNSMQPISQPQYQQNPVYQNVKL